jgi:hypothetical protein
VSFAKGDDFPAIKPPLPKQTRMAILAAANRRFLALGPETTLSASKVVLDTLFDILAAPLAKNCEYLVDEVHNELACEIAFGQRQAPPLDSDKKEWFRTLWSSAVISKVFNRIPGVPNGHMIECFFDYEVTEGRPEAWNTIPQFCAFMARRAIISLVSDRLPGQSLSFFGIVKSDLIGIENPGYAPSDRDDPVIRESAPARAETESPGINLAMLLALGFLG